MYLVSLSGLGERHQRGDPIVAKEKTPGTRNGRSPGESMGTASISKHADLLTFS